MYQRAIGLPRSNPNSRLMGSRPGKPCPVRLRLNSTTRVRLSAGAAARRAAAPERARLVHANANRLGVAGDERVRRLVSAQRSESVGDPRERALEAVAELELPELRRTDRRECVPPAIDDDLEVDELALARHRTCGHPPGEDDGLLVAHVPWSDLEGDGRDDIELGLSR